MKLVRADKANSEESPQAQTGKRGGAQRVLNIATVVLLLIALTLGVLYLIPSDYYLLLPGNAVQVDPLIHVKGHPTVPKRGSLYLTDVTFLKADHLLVELYGRLNPDAELQKAVDFTGGVSETQYVKLNTSLMNQSIVDAQAAALSTIPGEHPKLAPTGPQIAGVLPNTEAARLLKPGDVIEDMDGQRIHQADQVRPLVQKLKPGQRATLTILRHKHLIHLTVRTVAANNNGIPDKKGTKPLIGILVQDQIIFPIKISISHGNIVGPSAGLMFSLGIIQHLSKTDITKGCKIAGTGTIDFKGHVGEIGGAKQKIIAARNAGIRYFFVPNVADNRVPAEQNRGSVTVVPVSTLRQVLNYLHRMPPCK
jgi:PDZ domain-containing protein